MISSAPMVPTASRDVAPLSGIDGVVVKELITHDDERGFFREVIRETDGFFEHFGQWSHSLMYPGITKAWHIHRKQTDWWYVMGDAHAACVKIPPGVAHGCRALELTHLLYVTSHVYDPDDEGRIPHDDPTIGYDWMAGPAIK